MKTYPSRGTRFDHPTPQQDTLTTGQQGQSVRPPGYRLDFADSQLQPIQRAAAISSLPLLQAKLTVGAAGDQYEQEADRVAAQVMRLPVPAASAAQHRDEDEQLQAKPLAASITPLVQRTAGLEAEPQAKSITSGGVFAPGADFESRLAAARSGGAPLPDSTRGFMEQLMGADFSGVKVHTDVQSDQLNRSIQANAFTTGQNIFFRQGAYHPGSQGGQALLAHELTHVVQQNGVAVRRSPVGKQQERALAIGARPNVQGGQRSALANVVQRQIYYNGEIYTEANAEELQKIGGLPKVDDVKLKSPNRFVLSVDGLQWVLDPRLEFKRYTGPNKVGERISGASEIGNFTDVGYEGQEQGTRTGPKHPTEKRVSQISIWGTSGENRRDNHWWLLCDVTRENKETKYLKVDLTSEAYRIMYGAGKPNNNNKEWTTITLQPPTNIELVYYTFVEIAKEKGRWIGGKRYNCQDFALEMLRRLGLTNTEGYNTMVGLRDTNKA